MSVSHRSLTERGRSQVEALVHVEAERAVRIDVGPEQRGQAAPVLGGQLLRQLRLSQDLLEQQGVDVHKAGLKEVQRRRR